MARNIVELAKSGWPELVDADEERNIGLPLELFSAEGYAERDGLTVE